MCEKCLYKTNSQSRLIEHNEKYHSEGANNCIYCDFKATDLQDLKSHLNEIHADHKEMYKSNQRYICDKCPFKSNSKPVLEKHVECIHGGTTEYQCEHCEYKTMFAKELRKHYLYRHKPGSDRIPCDQCHFTTTRADALKRHVENKHLGIKHQCNQCSYSTGDKSDLTKHKRFTHAEKVTCDICFKELTAWSIEKHRKKHKLSMKHENWKFYPHVCFALN